MDEVLTFHLSSDGGTRLSSLNLYRKSFALLVPPPSGSGFSRNTTLALHGRRYYWKSMIGTSALSAGLQINASNPTLRTNGSVFVDNSVGIGTTSPGAKLHVSGGDSAITNQGSGLILRATDGPNCFRVTVNNAGTVNTASVACP